MSSAFPLPFKVDNLAKPHSEILYHVPLCGRYIPPFHLKKPYKYEQLFHQQNQSNYKEFHLSQLLHLHIPVNVAVIKKLNSMNLACDGDVDK